MAAIPDPDFGGNRTSGDGRGSFILAVSDQQHIARLIQVNLERAGYRVALASNEKAALTHIANEPPELVILDVAMLQTEVLRELRVNPKPQIILLVNNEKDFSFGRFYPAASVQTIPFNPHELVALIHNLLRF